MCSVQWESRQWETLHIIRQAFIVLLSTPKIFLLWFFSPYSDTYFVLPLLKWLVWPWKSCTVLFVSVIWMISVNCTCTSLIKLTAKLCSFSLLQLNRMDSLLYLLVYPQRPLLTTRTIELVSEPISEFD